jgi:hypothetical protein
MLSGCVAGWASRCSNGVESAGGACSEKGIRLVQVMQVGPCIPVGIQL